MENAFTPVELLVAPGILAILPPPLLLLPAIVRPRSHALAVTAWPCRRCGGRPVSF
jgi:hypothetical protein